MTAHGTSRTIGSWGGRRKGAGRKREFGLSDRREIAGDYFACMQKRMGNVAGVVEEPRVEQRRRRLMMGSVAGVVEERRPFREALIRKLMANIRSRIGWLYGALRNFCRIFGGIQKCINTQSRTP
jgi:hypothetical protein